MGDQQFGYCDICGATAIIRTTFFSFPIACECCGPTHNHRVNICKNCKPVMPKEVKLTIKVEKLLDPIHEGLFKKVP
jgi:hypothetical protein